MNLKQLYRRAAFGGNFPKDENRPAEDIVNELISAQDQFLPVKTYTNEDYPSNGDGDEKIEIGQPWVGHLATSAPVKEARRASLKNAWMLSIIARGDLREKMVFFWHNHFGVTIDPIYESHICWQYHETLRRYALGNFREMIKEITLNAAMLIFLNGDGSVSGDANRNYARELFERFTLGLGRYTEEDISQAAEMLAGFDVTKANGIVQFRYKDFDSDPKQFSEYFGYIRIDPNGNYSYPAGGPNELADLIFQSQEQTVASFIVDKLLSYFVANTDHPTEFVDQLAQVLIDNDWEMKPLLMELFLHPYFSHPDFEGCQIKSPLELIASVQADFMIDLPWDKPVELYRIMGQLRKKCAEMGLDLGEPPSVKGWDAYTQAPEFDILWYTSDAAVIRAKFLESLFDPWTFQLDPPYTFSIDVLEFTKKVPAAEDPNSLLSEVVDRLFPLPWTKDRLDKVKVDILLSGQAEDRYWTNAWKRYLEDPNERNTAVVKERLTALYKYLVSLEEYQLQ
jgi:uncharacterized protein (DUF1800 family)